MAETNCTNNHDMQKYPYKTEKEQMKTERNESKANVKQKLSNKCWAELKITLVGVFLWRRSVSRGPSGDGMGRN